MRQLLWIACRRHTHYSWASSKNSLYRTLWRNLWPWNSSFQEVPKDVWSDLDLADLILHDIPPHFQNQWDEILNFIEGRQRHTWYFTEENIPFSLFNESIPFTERQLLADAIFSYTSDVDLEPIKFTLSTISEDSQLHGLAGPRSKLLFELVGVPLEFLQHKYTAVKGGVQAF